MGYRSQVRAVIYGDPEKLQAFITKAMLEGCSVFEHFKDDLRRYRSALRDYDAEATAAQPANAQGGRETQWKLTPIEVLDLKGDDWKWYDDYADVKAWHALMDESADFDLSWEFVRVGEETPDVVMEHHLTDDHGGDLLLGVERSIYDQIEVKDEDQLTMEGAPKLIPELCEGA
jgi:hypothetical protein